MLQIVRRIAVSLILLGFVAATWSAASHRYSLFVASPNREEAMTAAQYLVSSLIGCLASIIAVSIAVLFITAQISGRSYARTLSEVYRDGTTFLVLGFYAASICGGIICLAKLTSIANTRQFWYVDLVVYLGLASVFLLLPLILVQVENINPILLASKLLRRVTTTTINRYQLSHVDAPEGKQPSYRLLTLAPYHSAGDPLGPFHELVMAAVNSNDRVSVSLFMRLLLKRIAVMSAVPYPMTLRAQPRRVLSRVVDRFYLIANRPKIMHDQITMMLHVLHYVIRRSMNLRMEWGDLDHTRHQYVFNIGQLIDALSLRLGTEPLIGIGLFATMHICFGYSDVPRYGRTEPLLALYELANKLEALGMADQSALCVEVLAVIAVRTPQLPSEFRSTSEGGLTPRLRAVYDASLRSAQTNETWLPGVAEKDPWRNRIALYKISKETHRVILCTER